MTDATMITSESAALAWNNEYERQGIPSSHRNDPSGVVVWALDNLPHVAARNLRTAIDLGCGTGRNSLALSAQGFSTTGVDFSQRAIATARGREGAEHVTFIHGDLTAPLPVKSRSQDLAIDVFVYFHQLGMLSERHIERRFTESCPRTGCYWFRSLRQKMVTTRVARGLLSGNPAAASIFAGIRKLKSATSF